MLALLLLSAGAASAGYLIEAHDQRAGLAQRLADAADYVEHGAQRVADARWQQGFSRRLVALDLMAQLTIAAPGHKRAVYVSRGLGPTTPRAPGPLADLPSETFQFPLPAAPLVLDLYAPALNRAQRLLIALAAGFSALLVCGSLLMWAASRWLVIPLRRLNTQVDAIAGGDPVQTPAASPIREVANVAQAIAGMGATLARTAEDDARLQADRRLLVSSIAHDLRTPLFSLRGYLDAIAAGIGDPKERLDGARAKARQIDRLVTGLFAYTKAGFDNQPALHVTDLADVVADTVAAFEFAADERGVELKVTADATHSVRLDRHGFERALANVIDNALRHTPSGGTVEVTSDADADSAFVRVRDEGPGMPSDLLTTLPGRAMRASTTGDGNGAGLGLTIAARLLQNQHGTIEAINATDGGAIVTLRLPRKVV